MKRLPIMALVLFFICLLAVPVYSDVQHENQEDRRVGQTSQPEPDAAIENSSQTNTEGRKVILENGEEFVIVEVPDSWKKKMRLRFNKEGQAHVSCH